MSRGIPAAYLHDLRHTLGSRTSLAVVVILAFAGVATLANVQSSASYFPVGASALYYYGNGAYHLSVWAYDAGGNPLPGVRAEVYEWTGGSVNRTTGPISMSTNGAGELSIVTIPVPNASGVKVAFYYLALADLPSVTPSWQGFLNGYILNLSNATPGKIYGVNLLVLAGTTFYSSETQAMVFEEGANGSRPSGYRLEDCWGTANQSFLEYGNCTGLPTQSLGPLSGVWTHFRLSSFPANTTYVVVQLVNSTGTIIASSFVNTVRAEQGGAQVVNNAPGTSVLSEFGLEEDFFLALVGLLGSYWIYAGPRLSGTVEPVLARPVTRRGLLLERFAAVTVLASVAAAVDTLVLDGIAGHILGEPLPLSFFAPLILTGIVAGLGIAALTFVTAHVVGSPGTVIAVGFLLVVVSLFWPYLVSGLLFTLHPGGTPVEQGLFIVRSQFLLPTQFPALATEALSGMSWSGYPLGASLGGLGVGEAALIAVAWLAVPLAEAYGAAVTRD
jgi:ABC-type transport system involved in multi-copper enzyme maturation permease subunit